MSTQQQNKYCNVSSYHNHNNYTRTTTTTFNYSNTFNYNNNNHFGPGHQYNVNKQDDNDKYDNYQPGQPRQTQIKMYIKAYENGLVNTAPSITSINEDLESLSIKSNVADPGNINEDQKEIQ